VGVWAVEDIGKCKECAVAYCDWCVMVRSFGERRDMVVLLFGCASKHREREREREILRGRG
jgi:hypothetical protein